MKSLIVILIMLTFTSASAFAVDSNGNYAVWGVGKKSCFGYSKEFNDGGEVIYRNYIKGFLTAYNIFTEKTYSISGKMNEDQIIEWLDEYCGENPMSGFETALLNFTFEHHDKRMKSSGTGPGR